jgi:hypothetical protein
MSLPKIDVPIYDLVVPSTGQEVKVRPFTVKEEKLLLIALESKNEEEIISTVRQVINNCIFNNDLDIDKLPFFDVDYIFIFLRAKSVGDTVTVKLTCNAVVEGEPCGNVFPTDMDIAKVDIVKDETIESDIRLDASSGVKMKYPGYNVMKFIEKTGNTLDQKTSVIVNSIEYIYDKKGMYSYKDYSKEELKEFIEGLTEQNYKKLERFVDNFPSFAVKLDATCTKCGFEHHVRYTDFYDFFL